MKKLIYLLLTLAAVAQGVLWVNVFKLLHDGILIFVGGLPAGMAIVGLVVYAANALPRVQSKRAQRAGWIFLGLVVIVEPVVLGFANYPVIMHQSISWMGADVVAGGASLTITLALILGALVDRSLIPVDKQPPKLVTETPKPPRNRKNVAEKRLQKPIKDDELLSFFAGNPGATNTDAAQHFGVTRQAIGKRVKKLYEVKQ